MLHSRIDEFEAQVEYHENQARQLRQLANDPGREIDGDYTQFLREQADYHAAEASRIQSAADGYRNDLLTFTSNDDQYRRLHDAFYDQYANQALADQQNGLSLGHADVAAAAAQERATALIDAHRLLEDPGGVSTRQLADMHDRIDSLEVDARSHREQASQLQQWASDPHRGLDSADVEALRAQADVHEYQAAQIQSEADARKAALLELTDNDQHRSLHGALAEKYRLQHLSDIQAENGLPHINTDVAAIEAHNRAAGYLAEQDGLSHSTAIDPTNTTSANQLFGQEAHTDPIKPSAPGESGQSVPQGRTPSDAGGVGEPPPDGHQPSPTDPVNIDSGDRSLSEPAVHDASTVSSASTQAIQPSSSAEPPSNASRNAPEPPGPLPTSDDPAASTRPSGSFDDSGDSGGTLQAAGPTSPPADPPASPGTDVNTTPAGELDSPISGQKSVDENHGAHSGSGYQVLRESDQPVAATGQGVSADASPQLPESRSQVVGREPLQPSPRFNPKIPEPEGIENLRANQNPPSVNGVEWNAHKSHYQTAEDELFLGLRETARDRRAHPTEIDSSHPLFANRNNNLRDVDLPESAIGGSDSHYQDRELRANFEQTIAKNVRDTTWNRFEAEKYAESHDLTRNQSRRIRQQKKGVDPYTRAPTRPEASENRARESETVSNNVDERSAQFTESAEITDSLKPSLQQSLDDGEYIPAYLDDPDDFLYERRRVARKKAGIEKYYERRNIANSENYLSRRKGFFESLSPKHSDASGGLGGGTSGALLVNDQERVHAYADHADTIATRQQEIGQQMQSIVAQVSQTSSGATATAFEQEAAPRITDGQRVQQAAQQLSQLLREGTDGQAAVQNRIAHNLENPS